MCGYSPHRYPPPSVLPYVTTLWTCSDILRTYSVILPLVLPLSQTPDTLPSWLPYVTTLWTPLTITLLPSVLPCVTTLSTTPSPLPYCDTSCETPLIITLLWQPQPDYPSPLPYVTTSAKLQRSRYHPLRVTLFNILRCSISIALFFIPLCPRRSPPEDPPKNIQKTPYNHPPNHLPLMVTLINISLSPPYLIRIFMLWSSITTCITDIS
jgi:hypothetical protein